MNAMHTLIERTPPPGGCLLVWWFTNKEPGGRGPSLKNKRMNKMHTYQSVRRKSKLTSASDFATSHVTRMNVSEKEPDL